MDGENRPPSGSRIRTSASRAENHASRGGRREPAPSMDRRDQWAGGRRVVRAMGEAHRPVEHLQGWHRAFRSPASGTGWRTCHDGRLGRRGHQSRSLEGVARGNSFERLSRHERVLFTPHVAGWTQESLVGLGAVLADKVLNAWSADGTKNPDPRPRLFNALSNDHCSSKALRRPVEYSTFSADASRNSFLMSVTKPILVSWSTLRDTHILLCSASANVKRSRSTQS